MAVYNHASVEKKWHDRWEEKPINPKTDRTGKEKEKYYCLAISYLLLAVGIQCQRPREQGGVQLPASARQRPCRGAGWRQH